MQRIISLSLFFLFLVSCKQSDQKIYNTTVDVQITKLGTQDGIPNVQIDSAFLDCSKTPFTDGESEKIIGYQEPTSPKEWCDAPAINTPITTDAKGRAKLFFLLNPSPIEADIKLTHDLERVVPMLRWRSKKYTAVAGMEVRTVNEWNVFPTMRENP